MAGASRTMAAVLPVSVPGIAVGGYSPLTQGVRRIPGYLDNHAAGHVARRHAPAGVLVTLALVAMLYVDREG